MKRVLTVLLLLSVLLMIGCSEAQTPTESTAETSSNHALEIPQELPGVWVSADAGKLMMSETITFGEDGSLSVSGIYQDSDMGTIYGTYRVEYNRILCDITGGTTPFRVSYAFRIDGRELILTDDDGDATYLRTS